MKLVEYRKIDEMLYYLVWLDKICYSAHLWLTLIRNSRKFINHFNEKQSNSWQEDLASLMKQVSINKVPIAILLSQTR